MLIDGRIFILKLIKPFHQLLSLFFETSNRRLVVMQKHSVEIFLTMRHIKTLRFSQNDIGRKITKKSQIRSRSFTQSG